MNTNQKKYQNLRQEKHATSVVCDTYDQKAYEKLKGQAQKLQELEENGTSEMPTFPPLMQDVYSSLYKMEPELRKAGEILPSHRINRSLVEQLMKMSEFKELRTYTRLDEFNSAMATLSLASQALTLVPKEMKDKADEMSNLESQIDSLEDQVVGMQNLLAGMQASQGKDELKAQAKSAEISLEEAKQKLSELEDGFEKELTEKAPELRGTLRKATNEALEEVKETSEFLEMWGK